ncbi:arginine--tRNA ligase domain-containing protein [Candidatus Vampirococcus lugosii]|uniref:Arginyl-tRNA synthetase n=1 Tax=Candidatus Vampirococcus lugosii TaxID=2789015 RepID=A0ABS5QK38_9BACT|nr:arginine--tRNA ligase [Candidatus Vampirococcus lugosii]MBS8121514.1 arginyl-tRNA synthetase [Candidatus Vampirococcus lugosii]
MLKNLIDKLLDNYSYQYNEIDFFQNDLQNIKFKNYNNSFLDKNNFEIYKLNNEIINLLKKQNIQTDDDFVIEIPNLDNFDFVFSIKKIFDLNKNNFDNIKSFADFVYEILSKSNLFQNIIQQGIFINLEVKESYILGEIDLILNNNFYPKINFFENKKICIDYPSCNMAKQMTVGHLRSAIIGESLSNIFETMGAKVFRWNYLGDWGTPFGKTLYSLIYEYQNNGKEIFDKLDSNPTENLGKLYSSYKKIDNEQKNNFARKYFSLLENGDPLIYDIRQEFRRLSLLDFEQIFERLNIKPDTNLGEFFSYSIQDEIIKDLEKSNYLKFENNAFIVKFQKLKQNKKIYYQILQNNEGQDIDENDIEILMIKKSDGAGTYASRDLALLKYRKFILGSDEIYYIVGPE